MPFIRPTDSVAHSNALARRVALGAVSLSLLAALAWIVDPREALARLGAFPPGVLALLAALFAVNLLLVSFRFWRIAAHFSIALPWMTALRANLAGNVAGLFFIPLVGQVAGRQALLRGMGVPPLVNTSIAAYEKILLAAVSGTLALTGAFLLMEWDHAMQLVGELSLTQVAVAGACGYGLSLTLSGGAFERGLLRGTLRWSRLLQLLETLGTTLLGQGVMLSCFVLGFHAVAPQVATAELFAAAAVVSFAASLPLSVGGWGAREVAAVYCLGKLGVPAPDALAASIVIGLCSTAVLLATVPLLRQGRIGAPRRAAGAMPPAHMEKVASWLLGTVMAVAVFFQVHVSVGGELLSLNLADPFALLALAALALQCLGQRRAPAWRVPRFNLLLGCALAVLLLGLFIGLHAVGPTRWALGGRGMGALVLLGYCAGGALLVANHGAHGLRRALEAMIAVACVIVLMQIALRSAAIYGLVPLQDHNFSAYAANRNAFAFQVLCMTAALLGYMGVHARRLGGRRGARLCGAALGVLMAGLLFSGSRAGLGAAGILLAVAVVRSVASLRALALAACVALGLWMAAPPGVASPDTALPMMRIAGAWYGLAKMAGLNPPPAPLPRETLQRLQLLEHARWKTNREGLALWRDAPVLGQGLGTFYARSQELVGQEITIHSTPIWVLAEFGLAGMAVLLAGTVLLGRHALRHWRAAPRARTLGLLLLAFAVFCQVHEVLYQRMFWLLLGLLLAAPPPGEPAAPAAEPPQP